MHTFSIPWKHQKTVLCFQGVEKECIGSKWVKRARILKQTYSFRMQVSLSMFDLLVDTRHKEFTKFVLIFPFVLIPSSNLLHLLKNSGNHWGKLKHWYETGYRGVIWAQSNIYDETFSEHYYGFFSQIKVLENET